MKITQKQLDQAVNKELVRMMKDDPQKLTMFMLIQMGKMCVEANAASLKLTQCSTLNKQRYQVKANITVKKVPINTP